RVAADGRVLDAERAPELDERDGAGAPEGGGETGRGGNRRLAQGQGRERGGGGPGWAGERGGRPGCGGRGAQGVAGLTVGEGEALAPDHAAQAVGQRHVLETLPDAALVHGRAVEAHADFRLEDRQELGERDALGPDAEPAVAVAYERRRRGLGWR